MQVNNTFTAILCIQQALMCYINSFTFKNLHRFGSMQNILAISNIAEIANNIIRAASMIGFRYISYNSMFIINNVSAIALFFNTILFTYALYDGANIKLCSIAWLLNRVCNSINASCRDSMLYKLNKEYEVNINIPIIKTIKAFGNIALLLKIVLVTSSIYHLPLIYFHFLICIVVGFMNVIGCWILHYYSNKLIKENDASIKEKIRIETDIRNAQYIEKDMHHTYENTASKETHIQQNEGCDNDETYRDIIKTSFRITIITVILNIAQVDDALVFYQVSENKAFLLKQCIGQIGLGLAYSLIFKNSRALLVIGPIIPLLFHQFSIMKLYVPGVMIMGLQYMLKNASYLLLSILLCKYNFIYPAVCIIADAISIFISNGLFMTINYYHGIEIAHIVFRNLAIIAVLFGIVLCYKSAHQNKNIR